MGGSNIITLTTDFGDRDGYVASLKGVILSINPGANIIDICNNIEPQNISQASFVVNSAYRYFPEGSIHLVVVDPGVGSRRKTIILKTPSHFFVAPDNGVLSYVIHDLDSTMSEKKDVDTTAIKRKKLSEKLKVISIENPDYWHKPVSPVFHGRDIFAPVAANLSSGLPEDKFGKRIRFINIFALPSLSITSPGVITGRVIYIDRFGNLVTNIKRSDLPPKSKFNVYVGKKMISGLEKYYAAREGLLALVGSSDYLEISFGNGNAAGYLNINIGAEVKVVS